MLLRRQWRSAVVLVVLLLVSAISALGQARQPDALLQPQPSPTPQASPTPSLEKQFFKNILRDQRAFVLSPFNLDRSDTRFMLPLTATAAVLIATDRRTAGALDDDSTRLRVSKDISQLGSVYTTSGVAAAFYLIGRAKSNARARETGLLGLEALVDSGIDVEVLKTITRRPRPRVDGGRGEFFDFDTGKANSFPSGHAITTWSLATVIGEEYRKRPAVRFTAYAVAAAVSISRFTGRNHFLSDVFVGSALGYGIGRYVYKTHHIPESDASGKDTSRGWRRKTFPLIAPQYNGQERLYGLALAWNF